MKLTSLVSVAFALITQSHACVHFSGGITDGGVLNAPLSGMNADVYDNNGEICNGPTYLDQDGHYSLTCLPGAVFAVTKTGSKAWYQNIAGQSWVVDLHTTYSEWCCGGESAKGHRYNECKNYDWDTWLFC